MSSIRTINLLWEQRVRGVYPVARYALDEAGTLVLAVPRPLEPRTYDLTRLTLDGGAELRGSFAVETLTKLELTAQADSFLGMTSDDLYLFHNGGKLRFQADRRLLYIDASLSADGRRLAVIFSDIAGASFAVAYGEIEGRVVWTRDLDVTPTAIALARNGVRMAMGTENGVILLLDSSRRDIWEFGQSEPVRAIACSGDGVWVAYGTSLGGVGLIDGHGTRRWEARLPGEVIGLALVDDGSLCTALCRPESDPKTTHLFCLVDNGQIAWEHDAERTLVGLSLAANGHYLAVSARNGALSVYEVVPGVGSGAGAEIGFVAAPARASELAAEGDLAGACRVLQTALDVNPADDAACEQLFALRARLRQERYTQAQAQYDAEDFAGAVATLEEALHEDSPDVASITLLQQARQQRGEQLLAQARARSGDTQDSDAEADLLAALTVAPDLLEARRELRALRDRRASDADIEAERLLAEGELELGVAALERAQSLAPAPERVKKLQQAHIAMEFAAGMAAYNAKRYQEAVFQFKKVLLHDPDHAEAQRYLGYAQKFAQDSSTESLYDRFRHLE